jgi:hypothetical protein
MSEILENSTIRIMNPDFETIGTGFIVSPGGLAVTCDHVVQTAIGESGTQVHIQLYKSGKYFKADVLKGSRSDHDQYDVAFLQIVHMPTPVFFAPLSRGSNLHLRKFLSLGFPEIDNREAYFADGNIYGTVPVAGKELHLLQLMGDRMKQGMSGAAVFDVSGNRVVGMMIEYIDHDQTRTAYAVTIDVLFYVCPELESEVSHGFVYRAKETLQNIKNLQTVFLTKSNDDIEFINDLINQLNDLVDDISNYYTKNPENPYKIIIDSVSSQTKAELDRLLLIFVRANTLYKHKNFPTNIRQEIGNSIQLAIDNLGHLVKLLYASFAK